MNIWAGCGKYPTGFDSCKPMECCRVPILCKWWLGGDTISVILAMRIKWNNRLVDVIVGS